MREDAERQKEELLAKKADAEARMGELKQKAADAKKRYDVLKKQNANDPVAVALEELEQKMRHHEQTVYVLTEYIETKGAESHFEGLAEDCLKMIHGINAETIQAIKDRPVFNPFPVA